ncbi:MAG TPA: serine/threonine protein phosphatase [Rhodospirillaceae bacterium]|nr:serine/threonine protein phosphatase [Rhodospirillaceae bacterium]
MRKKPSAPPETRLYVVGDIHGRLDLLTRLLAMIEANATQLTGKTKKLVFLGDYIDRGIDSRGVLERLTGSFAAGLEPIFLRGNHDEMMRLFLKGDLTVAPSWLQWGGAATVASYGVNAFNGVGEQKIDALYKSFSEKVPPAHQAFLEKTIFSATFGDYYFVHAGVKEGVPLEAQQPEDQLWARGDFLTSRTTYDKLIIHGHTISAEPEVKHNRIGIDTGAYATGHLTCLMLDGTKRAFLQT